MFPLFAIIIGIPAVALLASVLTGGRFGKRLSISSTLATMVLSLYLAASTFFGNFAPSETYGYISALGINLKFAATPFSVVLLLMASIVLFATALSGNPEAEREGTAGTLILLFQLAAVGIFTARNLFAFFIFWDIGVIALFFMINRLGSSNRKKASYKFLMYEIFASAMLFFGIILLYMTTHSLDIGYITANASSIPLPYQAAIFLSLFVAFMTNMPLFPMHAWLPDAHTEASTQGSMLLSGVLTKFGGFGMLLLFGMLPIAHAYALDTAVAASFSAFYAAFLLLKQTDIKRVIAYSTIVEMGIIMLGVSTLNQFGTFGAVYAMLSHGVTIALLFLVVGVLHYVFGERDISKLRGALSGSKTLSYAFIIGVFATTGIPLTATFVADILIFLGSLGAFGIYSLLPIFTIAVMGWYLYLVIDRSIMNSKNPLPVLNPPGLKQKIGIALLLLAIFAFGVFPFVIIKILKG